MTQKRYTEIPKRQKCINKEEPYIGGAKDILDDELNKPQSQINDETNQRVSTLEKSVGPGGSVDERIAVEKNRAEQAEVVLDGKIAAEKTRAEGVEGGLNTRLQTVEQLAEISVGGGDIGIGTAADFESDNPEDLAKVPTISAMLGGANDGVYDISARHSGTKYADLTAALGDDGANVPVGVRKGGMSVKFVLTSDNKYVQYRLMSNTFNTTPTNWQGVDDEPTAGSNNLVKSGGVSEKLSALSRTDYHIVATSAYVKGDKIIIGSGIVYNSKWNRIYLFNGIETSLSNDSYIVISGNTENANNATPIVKTSISDGDIVLAAHLGDQYVFCKELSVIYQTKNSYVINLTVSNSVYSLVEAINNVPPFARRGFVEILFIDNNNGLAKYSLPQRSWNTNLNFWQKEDTTFSIEDSNDGNIDFSELQFVNCEHSINEDGELVIIGGGSTDVYVNIPYYKNGTHVRIQYRVGAPDTWVYFGNGMGFAEQQVSENNYFERVSDTRGRFADFVINPRLNYGFYIKLYGNYGNTLIIKKISIVPNNSLADTLYGLSKTGKRNHVIGGVDLKDMHFKLKKVHGESWLRLPLTKVNFFNSVNDGFIIDWNTFLTNVDPSSIQHSIDKSVLNISFTKSSNLEYLLYKTDFVRNNSNQYLKLHVEQINNGDSLAVGLVSEDRSKFWILAIKGEAYQDSIPTKITGYRFSSNGNNAGADYPNYINDIAYDDILKEGNFDIEFAFFGTQVNVNVIKEGLTYPIFKAQITREDYDIYNDIVSENNYHYYIGTTSFNGANASIPKVSNLDFGLSSMWCGGADTKVVRYVDGTTYMDNGCFFVCSTAHGNADLSTGGATNIFKVDAKSFEFKFVGVLNGRYQGYVDILQSTSIRYNPNDGYWYIHGTNFGETASELEGGFAIGYIGKTKINPLGGNVVVDMQKLDLSGVNNCFDFDFLYDSNNKYWIGVLRNGATYKSENPLGTWVKISDGYNTVGYEYTEGSSFAIVNSKLLYTVGNRRDPNSPSIRDFITNEEIASINKDVPCSSSESTTPSWGNVFSIYENGISRYYLICFSGRKIKDMEYGYGDVFLYEAEETSEGEEYI